MATKKKKDGFSTDGVKILVRNKKAFHNYEISERIEAGMVLVGSEVKSLRAGKGAIRDAHVEIRKGQAYLVGMHINEYAWANKFNHETERTRKLLMHRREIDRLDTKIAQKGFTVVPLSLYLKNGRVKVELGVGKGKREYEKRHTKRDQEAKREIDRAIKDSR